MRVVAFLFKTCVEATGVFHAPFQAHQILNCCVRQKSEWPCPKQFPKHEMLPFCQKRIMFVCFLLLSNSRLVVRVARPRTADSNITTTNTQSLKPCTQDGLTNALSRVMKPFSNTYSALVHLVNTQLMSMKFGQPIHFGRLIAVLPGKTRACWVVRWVP